MREREREEEKSGDLFHIFSGSSQNPDTAIWLVDTAIWLVYFMHSHDTSIQMLNYWCGKFERERERGIAIILMCWGKSSEWSRGAGINKAQTLCLFSGWYLYSEAWNSSLETLTLSHSLPPPFPPENTHSLNSPTPLPVSTSIPSTPHIPSQVPRLQRMILKNLERFPPQTTYVHVAGQGLTKVPSNHRLRYPIWKPNTLSMF